MVDDRKAVSKLRFSLILFRFIVGCNFSSAKQVFTIGGWNQRGDANTFLSEWKPLLADYLTETVGPLYSPPVSFQLISMDWDENNTAEILIGQGLLDFVCTYHLFLCIAISDSVCLRLGARTARVS